MKRQRIKFPWDLYWENKTYKLKRSKCFFWKSKFFWVKTLLLQSWLLTSWNLSHHFLFQDSDWLLRLSTFDEFQLVALVQVCKTIYRWISLEAKYNFSSMNRKQKETQKLKITCITELVDSWFQILVGGNHIFWQKSEVDLGFIDSFFYCVLCAENIWK